MISPPVNGDSRSEIVLQVETANCKNARVKSHPRAYSNIAHTCHIDIKNGNVEIDHRAVEMLRRSGEFVVFHEQICLQPIGPG